VVTADKNYLCYIHWLAGSPGYHAGTFYRLIRDLGGEHNTVPLLIASSVSVTPVVTVRQQLGSVLLNTERESVADWRLSVPRTI
jgi:hypothetical protein